MKNFDYIKDLGIDTIYRYCDNAEEFQYTNPDISAVNARRALESMVRAIYGMKNIQIPDRTSLFELVDGEPFKEFINNDDVMRAIHYIRKVGNNGAHVGNVSRKESFFALLNLYNVISAILLKFEIIQTVKPFDKSLIPNTTVTPVEPEKLPKVINPLPAATEIIIESNQSVASLPTPFTEAETRKLFIDLMLKEAGWDVLTTDGMVKPLKACVEVELEGMPNPNGKGYADYVLFGSDGRPLAVIEAKRTSLSPIKGKHQAELYADSLEKQYGRRPVIYYTNGFENWIIDGLGYPPRKLYGFHTADDLELLIQQRNRHNITDFYVNPEITDRAYQKMAIKAVCEHYNKMHRKGLLVMATGTGKTRVAISLVDVLIRNGWVKNVLFLADRKSLVKQAKRNFVKLLPNTTVCELSDKSGNPDPNARIVFSTYQTMINYIDTENKLFSVGHFDLIIIDEAHRSIFGKYGAIFNYFDAMMVGLTATPRDQVDRSTYDIFEMEQGEPNYAYELEEAVADGYLVNYNILKRGTLVLKDGIKYDDLSEEEKDQMDSIWEYELAKSLTSPVSPTSIPMAAEPAEDYGKSIPNTPTPRNIEANEIFSYIFNEKTIDLVLQTLMNEGLKVQSGERIGKSIIFAYNHNHAELIVKRFNTLYPEYGPTFCALIDNRVDYAQDLIDKFEVRDGDPQIAVSVDMLDTGIDVPDVLNLVFFKRVRSKIKFMQMIGRGTRLSKNIFGEGKDKKIFYIFDWCRNFEYFDEHGEGQEANITVSLTERLFGLQAEIAFHLQHQQYQEDPVTKNLHDSLKNSLKDQVSKLSDDHITVRAKWENVSIFKFADAWQYISELDVLTLKDDIAPLIPKNTLDENAKKFDILVLLIELSLLDDGVTNATRSVQKVQAIANNLQNKATLPQVQAKMAIIKEVTDSQSWENVSIEWLEKVRVELRDLVKFLMGDDNKRFVIDIDDVVINEGEAEGVMPRVSYKQRVMYFLRENQNLTVLRRIHNLEQLTESDVKELERILWQELGNKEDYDRHTSNLMCGSNVAAFIRSIIGIDRKKAVEQFSDFISNAELNSEQEDFLSTVINYVCENGDITREIVANESPFDEQLAVVFTDYLPQLAKYINKIHTVIIPQTA
ncbi:MAG: DEAD/DEAH box helicase family protein [Muribaculaceae bacterium]|nr:DEAD/DEAH box helicase family protein [Muribaculaceae bacterium]